MLADKHITIYRKGIVFVMRFWLPAIGIVGLILLLKAEFPYAMNQPDQIMRIVYLLLLILLVTGGSGMIRRMRGAQAVRDAMLWLGIILVLVLGYSFHNEIRTSRLGAALVPSRIQKTNDGGLSIELAQDGHFHMEAEVNGVVINFMVDTGASDIVLSPQDAKSAGFPVETLNYSRAYHTANGTGSGAPVIIKTMMVGAVTLTDVPASVNAAPLENSLLGMTFLQQFREYRVNGDTLTLYP